MTIIKPTNARVVCHTPDKNGRVVWYMPDDNDRIIGMSYFGSPLAAIVCDVHGDHIINVLVIDGNGVTWPRCRVTFVQEGDPVPPGRYCRWMPYQLGQAAREATPQPDAPA